MFNINEMITRESGGSDNVKRKTCVKKASDSSSVNETKTDSKVVKTFIQYVSCHDMDTGEVWMEGFRSFVAKDSFLKKRMTKRQIANAKKAKLKANKESITIQENKTEEEVL